MLSSGKGCYGWRPGKNRSSPQFVAHERKKAAVGVLRNAEFSFAKAARRFKILQLRKNTWAWALSTDSGSLKSGK